MYLVGHAFRLLRNSSACEVARSSVQKIFWWQQSHSRLQIADSHTETEVWVWESETQQVPRGSVPDVLSHLSVPGQKAIHLFSYPLSNEHRLRNTDLLIRPGWFSQWRNLCAQKNFGRRSVAVNRRSDGDMGAAVARRAHKDSWIGLAAVCNIFASPVPNLTTRRPTDVRVPSGF